MNFKNIFSGKIIKKAINSLFIVFILFFIFSTDAKSWLLQQFVSTGLFNAQIKKEDAGKNSSVQNVAFMFTGADGKTLSTNNLKGKVLFINFWATWCPPCRAEMPSLNALYNKLKDDSGFVFLFINEDEDQTKALTYLQNNHFSIPLYTTTGNISQEIFSGTLPTTIVLNKRGEIMLKHEGMAGYNTTAFIRQLKGLL